MDIAALAAQAIGLISTYLVGVASGAADQLKDSATGGLHRLVTGKLRQTKLGEAVLDGLEEEPSAPERQAMAANALTEAANADAGFAEQLAAAVNTAVVSQSTADQSMVQNQANVHAAGAVTMTRSVIAGGAVNQSRTMKFAFGGVALVVVLVLAIVFLVRSTKPDRPALDPDAQIEEIGVKAGEEGARESARAYLDAWSVGNADLACKLLETGDATNFGFPVGGCTEAVRQHSERMSPDKRDQLKNTEIASVRMSSEESARVNLTGDVAVVGDTFRVRYLNGRWLVTDRPQR